MAIGTSSLSTVLSSPTDTAFEAGMGVHKPGQLHPSENLPPSQKGKAAMAVCSPLGLLAVCSRLELLTVVLATVSLTALLVLLWNQNGKPLSSWTFVLSINTVVSILSLGIRAPSAFLVGSSLSLGKWAYFRGKAKPISHFVAFDDASRGPLGAVVLLAKLKSRYLASLGAWITILLVAVDPFFQALVEYDGRAVSTGDATMPYASGLDIGVTRFNRSSGPQPSWWRNNSLRRFEVVPDVGISSTFLMGFINSSVSRLSQPQPVSCRTGNCTWPLYSTLEVCCSCRDVSTRVTKHSVPLDGRADEVIVLPKGNVTEYRLSYPGRKNDTLSIQGFGKVPPLLRNPPLDKLAATGQLGEENTFINQLSNGRIFALNHSVLQHPIPIFFYDPPRASRVVVAGSTISFRDLDTLLASFAVLQPSREFLQDSVSWEEAPGHATECALYFCANTYRATMQKGELREIATENDSSSRFSRSQSEESFALVRLTEAEQSLPPRIEQEIESELGLSGHTEIRQLDGIAATAYFFDRSDLQLNYSGPEPLPPGVQRTFNISQRSIMSMTAFLLKDSTAASIEYALQKSSNITATFESVARLVSNRMREINSGTVTGENYEWVVFIHVRWWYISYPVVIAAVGLAFYMAVVWQTWRQGLGRLKNDMLSVLLHGLDNQTGGALRRRWTEGMKVEQTVVTLQDTEDGVVLKPWKRAG